jgi:hypothetical protein
MIKKSEPRVKRLSALGMMGSVVSTMSEAIGLGLGIACVVVLLAGRGSDEIVEGRSASAAGWQVQELVHGEALVARGRSACDGEPR